MPSLMMACGCRAMAQRPDGSPSCVTHNCDEVSNAQPDLTGRVARCGYRDCNKEKPSSLDLAFFVFTGPGSYKAATMCKHCAYAIQAHWPQWRIVLSVDRLWYKAGRTVQKVERTFHAEPARVQHCAEHEADFFRTQQSPEARVFGVTMTTPEQIANPITKTHAFEAHGAYDADEFYCGCKGWD